jgi:hypothetical protein
VYAEAETRDRIEELLSAGETLLEPLV